MYRFRFSARVFFYTFSRFDFNSNYLISWTFCARVDCTIYYCRYRVLHYVLQYSQPVEFRSYYPIYGIFNFLVGQPTRIVFFFSSFFFSPGVPCTVSPTTAPVYIILVTVVYAVVVATFFVSYLGFLRRLVVGVYVCTVMKIIHLHCKLMIRSRAIISSFI